MGQIMGEVEQGIFPTYHKGPIKKTLSWPYLGSGEYFRCCVTITSCSPYLCRKKHGYVSSVGSGNIPSSRKVFSELIAKYRETCRVAVVEASVSPNTKVLAIEAVGGIFVPRKLAEKVGQVTLPLTENARKCVDLTIQNWPLQGASDASGAITVINKITAALIRLEVCL